MKEALPVLLVLALLAAGCAPYTPQPSGTVYVLPPRPSVTPVPTPTPFPVPVTPLQPLWAVRTVVLDAGHGGHDLGASYLGVHEKVVNLDIATKLAEKLRTQGMQVTLTRTTDTFVTLEGRSEIANRVRPDLFISVHANAAKDPQVNGLEVFYVAETFTQQRQDYNDAWRAVQMPYDVTEQHLARWREQSMELAKHIEHAATMRLDAPSRGVKRAGFAVLKWTCSPAVLVEVGFLSNAGDRGRLSSSDYRTQTAQALADGILSYRQWYNHTYPTLR